ncbi:substrate-binding domain-containing protein [Leeuwenhoekiella sp. MAR_2009_132]|uniref:substrate-binding domain-containing protein n=1 Tax=Leeuwenhoekiella sp. MAR_2009_132 TaxID=1392489 RepID=UPI00048B664A|nr:substrate-binding domain-containing protein [Leeuwenhoekiella sp. MAR_2009_132]
MNTLKVGGVPEHFNLPIHLCIEEGLFADAGIAVEWVEYAGGTGAMNAALRAGDIDVAIILTEGVVKDIAAGNPSRIIQNYVSSSLIWGVHVADGSKFKTIDDLKDTRPAISRFGSGSHVMAFIQAKQLGWESSAINCVVVNNLDTAAECLTKGDADYFMWEHFTTKPLVDSGVFRRVSDFPTPWSSFVIAATTDAIKTKKNTLEVFLEVLNNKTVLFKEIPEIEELLAKRYNQKLEDIKVWISKTNWSQSQIETNELENVQVHLKGLNMIDKEQDVNFYLTIN